ncbi:hypothetical protein [uncultured Deefgea sp.]|uniref:hypothetical protein n=1 Tax=uncultured Deefgea sp. TaxID=1304914 RepID=UPI00262B4599|nr:hypothetical protein [uncultured Deefgea sp.]
MSKKKSTVRSVAKKTITAEENQKDKEVQVPSRDFVFFFVGGAADKEAYYGMQPTKLINFALISLVNALSSKGYPYEVIGNKVHHLSYADAKGDDDIEKQFISRIKEKDTLIYLVGHSLGAWNSAHLSNLLTKKGYKVEFLITLDPVGDGVAVSLLSDIYWSKPSPLFEGGNWINVRAEAPWDNYFFDDVIADLGGQWDVITGPLINAIVPINHGDANAMFTYAISNEKSAMDHLIENFMRHIKPMPVLLPVVNLED